jgi:hypothetical protein
MYLFYGMVVVFTHVRQLDVCFMFHGWMDGDGGDDGPLALSRARGYDTNILLSLEREG